MLLLAIAALAPLHFHVDASEFANAVYHVACLTGRTGCSNAVFSRFWNERFRVTPEDGARFNAFASALDEVEKAAGEITPAPFLPNYAAGYPTLHRRTLILAAALASKSGEEFRRKARRLGNPDAIGRMAEALDGVEERLHPWWVSTGAPLAISRVKIMQAQIDKLGVPRLAAEVAAFLEVREFPRDVYLHVVPSPDLNGDQASASPNANHFAIEITNRTEANAAAWGTIHELTHSLYDTAPPKRKLALMQEFVDSPDPAAQGLYMYMNEAVATAVQLLILERNGQRDDDPYQDRYIPRLAFATLPLLRDALKPGRTLYDGFGAAYLAAGRRALGSEADSLAFRFSTPAVLGDRKFQSAFIEAFAPHWWTSADPKTKIFTRVHVVRVASSTDGYHRGAVTLSSAGELLLTGRDGAAIADLAKGIAEWQGKVEPGLLFTID